MNKLKNFLFFLGTCVLTAYSGAIAEVQHRLYIGGGPALMTAHHEATVYEMSPVGSEIARYGFSKTAPGLNFNLGYIGQTKRMFWGLELDCLLGSLNKTNLIDDTPQATREIKANSGGAVFGAAIRLGPVFLERVMPYIRLGVESRRFKLFHASNDLNVAPNVNISSSKYVLGIAPGLGVDFKLTERASLGAEYRTSFYRVFRKTGPNPGANSTFDYKISPWVSAVLITLKYLVN